MSLINFMKRVPNSVNPVVYTYLKLIRLYKGHLIYYIIFTVFSGFQI